jgi:hypothetical protein
MGLLGTPRIDKVVGPWGLDAGNRPILIAGKTFRIHGRNFPRYSKNLKISFVLQNKVLAGASFEKIAGSGNKMTIDATMHGVSTPGTCYLELSVVDGNVTRYKMRTLVALAVTPRFTIHYKGLRCLEETNEVGSDEPYTAFVVANLGNLGARGLRGAVHDNVDKGEHHPATVELTSGWELSNTEDALILVGLMENDDGNVYGVMDKVASTWKRLIFPPGYSQLREGRREALIKHNVDTLAQLLEGQAIYQAASYSGATPFNRDDLVGVKPLLLLESLAKRCVLSPGWKTFTLDISGDGGRYRLDFAIKAVKKSKKK